MLLVSAPWRLANWPSLAVGVLKAHLVRHGVAVGSRHLHFEIAARIGFDLYERIANGWELGEALYFALYAPDESDAILTRVAASVGNGDEAKLLGWARSHGVQEIESATLAAIADIDLDEYDIVGFSVGALQLGSSLYLARLFKERAPHLKIVFGGGGVLGAAGENLLKAAPSVDVVVDGEGETALLQLAQLQAWNEESLAGVPNVRFRRERCQVGAGPAEARRNIDCATAPDMEEFYSAARREAYPISALVLPLETSRGCAWEHRRGDGVLRGCTFCGLYRNSPNFRVKSMEALWQEILDGLALSHVLELSFVDAYLPPVYVKDLLRRLAREAPDVTIFCESRCDLDEEMVELLARSGVRRLQLGVEAFDTGILTAMHKGVRAIDNISSMKLCEEFGIPYQYNVMLRVPGIAEDDINASTALLPALHGFRPPSIAEFYLDRGSRMYADPARYGIRLDSLDRRRLSFLPDALTAAPVCQTVTFEAATDAPTQRAWNKLEAAIGAWRLRHEQRGAAAQLLSFRAAGPSTIVIADQRTDHPAVITLEGRTAEVFGRANRLARKRDLLQHFTGVTPGQLDDIVGELVELQLMVEEGNSMIALPVRQRLPNGAPRVWGGRA